MRGTGYRISVSAELVGDDAYKLDRGSRYRAPTPGVHEQAFGADGPPSPWELRVRALRREVNRLPGLERAVMRGRLAYEGRGEETLREIAQRLAVPHVTVWRAEQRALARLRHALNPGGWPAPTLAAPRLKAA